jgi:hypothetical protein
MPLRAPTKAQADAEDGEVVAGIVCGNGMAEQLVGRVEEVVACARLGVWGLGVAQQRLG